MGILGTLLLFIGFVGACVAAVMAIFKAKRRRALHIWVGSCVGIIAGILMIVQQVGHDAEAAGFLNSSDQSAAREAGISSGEEWYALQEAKKIEAAAEAERMRLAQEEREKRLREICRQDRDCWGRDRRIEAEIRCKRPIERLARFDHEWTNTWTQPMFSRFRWKDEAAGIMTYYGDSLRLQNGFGAWANQIYACEFNTETNEAVRVSVEPGRL